MASDQSPPSIFAEIAELFASSPQPNEILSFHLSDASERRASELLQLNKDGRLTQDERCELDHFEAAELLMRLVKARIRARQASQTSN